MSERRALWYWNWTATEVAHIAGIEYRTLHSWRERGLITPSIHNPKGSGNTALYSDDDLARAVVLSALRPFLTLDGLALLLNENEERTK